MLFRGVARRCMPHVGCDGASHFLDLVVRPELREVAPETTCLLQRLNRIHRRFLCALYRHFLDLLGTTCINGMFGVDGVSNSNIDV